MAKTILDKVNDMNLSTGRDCLIAAGVFAALPKDVTAPLALIGVVLGGLSLLQRSDVGLKEEK